MKLTHEKMKGPGKVLATVLLAALPFSSAMAIEKMGGTISFSGSVVTTTCAISSDSSNISVDLGQVQASMLSSANSEAKNKKHFSIMLEGCEAQSTSGVSVVFSGTADKNDPSSLATGQNGNSAQNVVIRIYDETGQQIALNTESSKILLKEGTNKLNFSAQFASPLGDATAGDASATATYTLVYS